MVVVLIAQIVTPITINFNPHTLRIYD